MSTEAPNSRRYQALIQLLRTAEDLWNASRTFFSRWDLSPSQFNVLNLLYGCPDGRSQSDLSRLLIMHRSNATGLVDRLEKRKLVRRQDDPGDRRAYRVVLTPAGVELLDEIYPHYFAAAERVWSDVPETRVEALVEELRELAAQAGAVAVLSATNTTTNRRGPKRPAPPAGPENTASNLTPASADLPETGIAASSADAVESELRTSDL